MRRLIKPRFNDSELAVLAGIREKPCLVNPRKEATLDRFRTEGLVESVDGYLCITFEGLSALRTAEAARREVERFVKPC